MEVAKRCIYCMLGTVSNGVCTRCGKPALDPRRPTEALPARYLLGRQYSIGRVLGNGGFGITYLAWDCKNNRRVAVKELFPRYPQNSFRRSGVQILVTQNERQEFEHVKKRFREEAQILHELKDVPEVINVYHLFEENGTAYYVMEYLEGGDLRHYLNERGTMKWEELVNPLCMILRALHALHGKGLIHRDISPDNIFISNDGSAKLIDFGAARDFTGDYKLTAILKGNFAPFEQFRSDPQGPYTDIYALSATLYLAIGGKLPIKAPERMMAFSFGDPDPMLPIQAICPDLPPHVAKALGKGLEAAAKNRPQTVAEFAEMLFPSQNIFLMKKISSERPNMNNRSGGQGRQSARNPQTGRCVQCTCGIYKGRSFSLFPGMNTVFGRNEDCTVRYPVNSGGISRRQCVMMLDNKGIAYIRDENSSYGTFVNGSRLRPMIWQPVRRGDKIQFATEEYYVV